ncbi:MAG: hypothetical protein Q8Q59_15040 [Luteolibacter sp.]|jgi:hypothetical protein|nr:hypothetical protein [Luteolibacter sp.]
MKRLLFPSLAAALLTAFLLWWFSPGQILKRRTLSLLETLAMDAGTGHSSRQMGVYALNGMLAPMVDLNTPTIAQANGSFERSDLESAYSWLCLQAKQTRFELDRFHSIKISGDQGEVEFSLEALVELPTYRPADGRYRVTFHWQRGEDQWRLASATWLDENR